MYMILKDNKDDLDLTLIMNVENSNYVVDATTGGIKCFVFWPNWTSRTGKKG